MPNVVPCPGPEYKLARHWAVPKSLRLQSLNIASKGYYNPIIAPIVFQEKKRVTLEQETRFGKKLVVTATPVFDERGEIDFVVMNSRDITHIEQLKQDLEKTKKLVEQYKTEVEELKQKQASFFEGFNFHSKQMKYCMEMAERVASVDTTVLITGQSGTGKNVLAKEIHKMSKRKSGPFISINCAAIPEQLLESELFGYCRGAFTGAEKSGKAGLVEHANNGTLFLDEIGEIPLSIQAKLLQLIQEHTFIPVGGKEQQQVNIRIVAATNRDLPKFIEEGKFREDLYYRLNVIEIEIPPLKERYEDIAPLLYYFLNIYDSKYNLSHHFNQECLDVLTNYSWPGNIRELEHLIERLVITVQDPYILPKHLPKKIFKNDALHMVKDEKFQMAEPEKHVVSSIREIPAPQQKSLKVTEMEMILQLYNDLKSSYKVAQALGISQSKVTRIVRKYSANTK